MEAPARMEAPEMMEAPARMLAGRMSSHPMPVGKVVKLPNITTETFYGDIENPAKSPGIDIFLNSPHSVLVRRIIDDGKQVKTEMYIDGVLG